MAFSPREIVSELDRHIIGQRDAKRAVAIALRNRWRRQQLEGEMREEVLPKHILMIGPNGVRTNELDEKEIEIQVADMPTMPSFEIPGMPGSQLGMINLSDVLGKALGQRTKPRKVTVRDSFDILLNDDSDKLHT